MEYFAYDLNWWSLIWLIHLLAVVNYWENIQHVGTVIAELLCAYAHVSMSNAHARDSWQKFQVEINFCLLSFCSLYFVSTWYLGIVFWIVTKWQFWSLKKKRKLLFHDINYWCNSSQFKFRVLFLIHKMLFWKFKTTSWVWIKWWAFRFFLYLFISILDQFLFGLG